MVMVVAALLVLLAAALRGGDLRRLASIHLRHTWLLPAALVLQFVVLGVLAHTDGVVVRVGHVVSYLMMGVFVYVNRAVPGLLVMAMGAASNGITITVNGGTLPASEAARVRAGLPVHEGFTNSGVLDDPKLALLGDVFAIPSYLPFANTYSIGDMLLVLGVAICVAACCFTEAGAARHEAALAQADSPATDAVLPQPRRSTERGDEVGSSRPDILPHRLRPGRRSAMLRR